MQKWVGNGPLTRVTAGESVSYRRADVLSLHERGLPSSGPRSGACGAGRAAVCRCGSVARVGTVIGERVKGCTPNCGGVSATGEPGAVPLSRVVKGVVGQELQVGPHEFAALVRFGVDRFFFLTGGGEEHSDPCQFRPLAVVDNGSSLPGAPGSGYAWFLFPCGGCRSVDRATSRRAGRCGAGGFPVVQRPEFLLLR